MMITELNKLNSVPMRPEFVLTRLHRWFKKLETKNEEVKKLIQENAEKLNQLYNDCEIFHHMDAKEYIKQHIIYYPCVDTVKVHKDKITITYDENIVNFFAATLILDVPDSVFSEVDKASLLSSPSLYMYNVFHMSTLGISHSQLISLDKFIALLYLMNYSMTDMETKVIGENRLYVANDPKCSVQKSELYYDILVSELSKRIKDVFKFYDIKYKYLPESAVEHLVECVIIEGE